MTVRIDNYVAPTSWDDLDMDWTDPDPTDCKYVHAIILAIKERLAGPSQYGYPVSLPVVSPDIRMKHSTLMTIHNWTFNLWKGNLGNQIRYLNCDEPVTDRTIQKDAYGQNSNYLGSYNYHICDPNYFSDVSIIEAIGDDSIIYPQPDMRDNKAWLIQQYKILNKLNIHLLYIRILSEHTYEKYHIYNGDAGYEYTSDWEKITTTTPEIEKTEHPMSYGGHYFKSKMAKIKCFTDSFLYDIDILGFFTKSWGGISYAPDAFSGLACEGSWFEESPASIPANTQLQLEREIGDLNLLSPTTSGSSANRHQVSYGIAGIPYAIGKINFNFQD